MTLRDWYRSDEHIKYARVLFAEPFFQDILGVLSSIRPPLPKEGASPTDAAILLGRREGMDQILGVLQDLTQFPQQPAEEVPADYGAGDPTVTS